MEQGGPWYLSGVFWAIVGVVVAVVLGIVAAWATFRSANPRRRLYVYLDRSLPVVRTHEALRNEIEVRHLGRTLSQPYVVTLNVVSRGRKDIPSSSFDANKPIVADLGVPIVRLLEEKSTTPKIAIPVPESSVDGTRILIGPSMLSKQHVLTYTALVEGSPNLATEIPLLDVDTSQEPPSSTSGRVLFSVGNEVGISIGSIVRLLTVVLIFAMTVAISLFF